jgi:hypothetical protein
VDLRRAGADPVRGTRQLRPRRSRVLVHGPARPHHQPDRPVRGLVVRPVLRPVRRTCIPVSGDARVRRFPAVPGARQSRAAGSPLQCDPRHRLRTCARQQLRAGGPAFFRCGLPQLRGRRDRRAVGRGPRRRHEFPGRHVAAARRVAGLRVARARCLVAAHDGPDRRLGAAGRFVPAREALCAPRRQHRQGSEAGAPGSRARRAEEGGRAQAAENRGAGAQGREKRARRERKAGRVVRETRCQCVARVVAAGRSTSARRRLLGRGARGNVAPGRTQIARFRRRSRGRRSASRSGDHALRAAPGPRRQGCADLEPRERPGSRALRNQRARGRDHSRQVDDGTRNPERDARDGHARRDHQVEGVRRDEFADRARAWQGHRRQPDGGRPRSHAAPAGRWHDGLRQIHRGQCDGAVAALQVDAGPRAADHDRPQDARTVGVRGHTAPARTGRHRHEAGCECLALVRCRDGAALPVDVVGRGAQPRRVQPQGQGRDRSGPAA